MAWRCPSMAAGLPDHSPTTRRFFMLTRRHGLAATAGLIAAPTIALPQSRERAFRFVVNVGLQNLDPISSPSFVTRNFAYLVYDTLVSMDMQGRFKPQMLQGWEVSADKLTWNFRLRPGLAFHDGAAVTAEDVVASLKRWGNRDSIGRRLMAATWTLPWPTARQRASISTRRSRSMGSGWKSALPSAGPAALSRRATSLNTSRVGRRPIHRLS
jgi:ABC-type transport system substrate-binding protein